MQLEIIMPVLMGCTLLWWVSRGMSWTRRLTIGAITFGLIAVVLLLERGTK